MIISQTPHRISFFGGGTDYPPYYLEHGGKVLGTAIDKYCYLNVRALPPFFDHKHRIVYSATENVNELDEINHPSVRETLRHQGIDYGVSIHHDADIPARSGMGSSSAFTVGLLNSLKARDGKRITKADLTEQAIYIEQKMIGEDVGSQDQTFAAYGGLNLIEFLQSGEIVVHSVIIRPERLQQFEGNLMLFFTGLSRIAAEVAKDQIANIPKKIDTLNTMKGMVDQAYSILTDGNLELDAFGELLNDTWKLKRSLSAKVTNDHVDEIYSRAIKAGAIGGKLLGAGNGGFMCFYVKPEKRATVRKALGDLIHVPFKFDFDGSKIIVYQPNEIM